MEASVARWFSDTGMDLPSHIPPWEVSSIDQFNTEYLWENIDHSFPSESYNSYPSFNQPSSTTSNNFSRSSNPNASSLDGSSPSILSFRNQDSPSNHSDLYTNFVGGDVKPKLMELSASRGSKRNYETMEGHAQKGKPSHNQEHIMAERKRREKLSQKFIALTAIIPGLKKMDKASVLRDAINYLHQLQEKVKILEEQAVKRAVESAILVKKSQLSSDDDSSSCDENFDGHLSGESLPEIEVKMSDKTALMRINCENRKGVLAKVLSVIENLHLTVINTSAVPFTSSSLDITIMAQMDEEFSMTVKDLLKNLNSAFRQFM